MTATHTAESPAKINLTLRVVGMRPDAFHEIESLVARVALSDELTVHEAPAGRFTVACDDPSIPSDDRNLAVRAARALAEHAGRACGAHIAIRKRIPAGAGLGGGSSNAATTLRLLNELWSLQLPVRDLERLGATLGSDVPLFSHTPVCVIRGRGEQIDDVRQPLSAWAVLILPNLHCSTPAVYAAWDRLPEHPQHPPLTEVLAAATSPARLMALLFNDLEPAAFQVEPRLRDLTEQVHLATGQHVRMTGSGAALFRLFDTRETAEQFAAAASGALGARTVVTLLLT